MMRTILLAGFGLVVLSPALAAERIDVPNGDFEKPVRGGALPGFEIEGPVATIGEKGARSLRLGAGGRITAIVDVPAPPAVDGIDPNGWFLLASIERRSEGPATEDLSVSLARSVDAEPISVEFSKSESAEEISGRRWILSLAHISGCEPGRFVLTIEADSPFVLDDLVVERHHVAPTAKLLGKENGVLGPDRLSCGAIGLEGLTEHGCCGFSVLGGRFLGEYGLQVGDVVVAVDDREFGPSSIAPGWDWFERSNEAVLGRALLRSTIEGRTRISFMALRHTRGSTGIVGHIIGTPFRDRDVTGFPLRGDLADALRADLVHWAVTHQRKDGSWPGAPEVNPALGGLALLATGDPAHLERVKKAVDFLMAKWPKPSEMKGLAYWAVAYQGMLLCEWHLATGDESVLPWIAEAEEWLPTTMHMSAFGMPAYGHGPDGLPYEDKALMAPLAHLLVFDALAAKCGVEPRVWESARAYVVNSWSDPESGGHGGMGYNGSYKDLDELWSRSGLVALAEFLRGDPDEMRGPLTAIMEERHPWMLNSHAYGEPGGAIGLLALSVVKRDAFERILAAWRWRFLSTWEPGYGLRYSTPHMGAPYMAEESVVNLAYLWMLGVADGRLAMSGVPMPSTPEQEPTAPK
ncbi:MAG: DUF6288 domain-containing protein [Planctomycetota bacterium]